MTTVRKLISGLSVSPSLSRLAVAYSLEADADLRKKGLIPRATFIDPSSSDKNYESTGVITMNTKGQKQCVTRQLAIQVF